jgi:phosphoribosylamine--glycine ligase / phosphoribosylformylglycinamidine cyclo-ligase
MSVNDLLVQGALPLYFLDYFGCSKLTVSTATQVISGIAEGCRQSNAGLIGGETAEMPGMYSGDEYDLAGFAVGAVERENLLPRLSEMKEGDVLLGIRSSGLHSNGFSLVRKVVARSQLNYDGPVPWKASSQEPSLPSTLGEALLIPTRIYVKALQLLLQSPKGLLGMSHITGGGFTENIPRVLPAGLGVSLNIKAWERPGVFAWLQKVGQIEPKEMARTFNNGIGMVLIVKAEEQERIMGLIKQGLEGEEAVVMGKMIKGQGVKYEGLEAWTL